MWRTNPGTPFGLFVRAGRFMPVFGLRFAEHPMYTRRFGGTPLYGDTYGAAIGMLVARRSDSAGFPFMAAFAR
jgi:hypothetical protein